MAKAGGKRHSKNVMQPVTINLEAVETKPEGEGEGVPPASEAVLDGGHSGPDDALEGIAPSAEDENPTGANMASSPEDRGEQVVNGDKPAAAAAKRRGGFIPAIIGGIVALAGAAALQWAGIIPERKPDLSGLQQVPGAISAIEERLGKLELAAADNSKAGADTGSLARRMSAAEAAIKAIQSRTSAGTGGEQLAKLSGRIENAESRIDELASAQKATSGADTGAISDQISEIEKKLDDTVASAASARSDLAGRIAALKSEVGELSASVQKQALQPRIAGAIAAAALKSAIDRGVPFSAELDTYAAVAGDSKDVTVLRNFAADGVPTQADLNGEIAQMADRMIAAARTQSGDEGVLTRLMAGAKSLVSVRPVGQVKGDTPEAIVARLEADINAGRLDAALKEYDSLPEASKTAAGPLAGHIKARLTADNIVSSTISGALVPTGSANGQGQ